MFYKGKAALQFIAMPCIKALIFLVIVVLSSSIALLNLVIWNYYRLGVLTGDTIHFYLIVSDWIVVFLFITELIWNFILCEQFDDLIDSENLIVLLIIFEICWENLGQRDLVIFYFLHVFY